MSAGRGDPRTGTATGEGEAATPGHEPGRSVPTRDAGLVVTSRKARDAGLILPLVGCVLLMPPVATLFATGDRILGVPLVVAYVFGVWAGLILAAFLLGRRLAATGQEDGPPGA